MVEHRSNLSLQRLSVLETDELALGRSLTISLNGGEKLPLLVVRYLDRGTGWPNVLFGLGEN